MVKIMDNPIKMDDLGVPYGTIIFGNIHIPSVPIFIPVPCAGRQIVDSDAYGVAQSQGSLG